MPNAWVRERAKAREESRKINEDTRKARARRLREEMVRQDHPSPQWAQQATALGLMGKEEARSVTACLEAPFVSEDQGYKALLAQVRKPLDTLAGETLVQKSKRRVLKVLRREVPEDPEMLRQAQRVSRKKLRALQEEALKQNLRSRSATRLQRTELDSALQSLEEALWLLKDLLQELEMSALTLREEKRLALLKDVINPLEDTVPSYEQLILSGALALQAIERHLEALEREREALQAFLLALDGEEAQEKLATLLEDAQE